jgi:protein-S-isoprenylcysteine O-methyltransferase Ste14
MSNKIPYILLQYAPLLLLCTFYLAYILKAVMLKRRHIKADILGKGAKPKGRAALELLLKGVTYLGAGVQFISVILKQRVCSLPVPAIVQWCGLSLMLLGVLAFILAIVTMKNNWRAGFAEGQNTSLVTKGIYEYSRNPAFLGFDLLYIGCAAAFPNVINLAVTLMAVVLFHLQILGEEAFLSKSFGVEYQAYKAVTMRYIGRKKER